MVGKRNAKIHKLSVREDRDKFMLHVKAVCGSGRVYLDQ